MNKVNIINKIISYDDSQLTERIYIGNDYCQLNLNEKEIINLIVYYKDKKQITLLLPFLTNLGLEKLSNILKQSCVVDNDAFEIVFNDWGTFFYLRKNYPKVKLVLGRLLTNQKKDPRISNVLKNKNNVVTDVLNKQIVYLPELPQSLIDLYYRHSIETPELIKFLTSNNVYRIELDNVVWKIVSELPKTIKVSLYYPYLLLSVTRYCGLLHDKYESVCNKDCVNDIQKLSNGFYLKGNAIYHKNDVLPSKEDLENNNIDRIVYQAL